LNKKVLLSERELEIINIVASHALANQRELSVKTGISLGMTNILVRRLVKKGYLKIRQLNQKKVEYLLTARGFVEKTEKSYRYTLRSIQSLMVLKDQISKIYEQKMTEGFSHFILVGKGDLPDLAEMVFKNAESPARLTRVDAVNPSEITPNSIVLHDHSFSGRLDSKVPRLNMIDVLAGSK
jgi:DNA-binding CsgD family transcriptional regulator